MSKNRSESDSVQEPKAKKLIKRLEVLVTQKEIDEAHRGNSRKCMIHQAIQRDHPKFINLVVDKNHVRFTDPKQNVIYTFQMSGVGRLAILKWDSGENVPPFKLNFRNPIIRERQFRKGRQRPKHSEERASGHLGPIPRPKTEQARKLSGRDRVFGEKLWAAELETARELFSQKDDGLIRETTTV